MKMDHSFNPFDELEEELRGLKPAAPSPELQKRVAYELNKKGRGFSLAALPLAPLYALAAAILIAMGVFSISSQMPRPRPTLVSVIRSSELPSPDAPSLANYHRALMEGGTEIDRVLDQFAQRPPAPSAPYRVFGQLQ